MSLSCLETFNYFPPSTTFKVKRLVTDLTKTRCLGLCSPLSPPSSLFAIYSKALLLLPNRQASSFSLPHSVPFHHHISTSIKALHYPLRYRRFDLFLVFLAHHLCSELRAGPALDSQGVASPLVFCQCFTVEPPHPLPASTEGWHPDSLRVQLQASFLSQETT